MAGGVLTWYFHINGKYQNTTDRKGCVVVWKTSIFPTAGRRSSVCGVRAGIAHRRQCGTACITCNRVVTDVA